MPKETSSPFTPGQPVSVEAFVGRTDELSLLARKTAQAASGRLEVVFLTGERGIGKTSLAHYVETIAETQHQMIGAHAYLGGVRALDEVARRAFDRILKDSVDRPWHAKVIDFLGKHVKKVGMYGVTVEFDASPKDLERLVHDFGPALSRLATTTKSDRNGIFLVLDDINGIASSSDFANWLKSLVDEIATSRQKVPLFLMLVGFEERRQELIALQPSLSRVFSPLEIRAWSDEETMDFYTKTFESVGMTCEEAALSFMAQYTGGLPMLAHEVGDAAFNIEQTASVSLTTARVAVMQAAEIVGRKYLDPQVYSAIRSPMYRSILGTVAVDAWPGTTFKRSDALSTLGVDEQKAFDSFLRRMRQLDVIRAGSEKGTYEFSNRLHHVYFVMESLDLLP